MLALVVLQITVAELISIATVQPNFPLLACVYIALHRNRVAAMLHGFPAGFLIDLYTGEVVGISSLSLLAAAFVAGFFRDEEHPELLLRGPRAVLITTLAALVFHLLYVFTYFRTLEFDIIDVGLKYVLGAALYTGILSSLPVLILARSDKRLRV